MKRDYKPLKVYANVATIALALYPIMLLALGLLATPQLFVFAPLLVTAATFLKWMFEASSNLRALGVTGQRFSPASSVYLFFIPFLHFFLPYQVMKEIWKGSYPHLGEGGLSAWRKALTSPIILFWWIAWIAFLITDRISSANDPLTNITLTDMVVPITAYILLLIATTLAIILLRRITSNQDQKYSTHFDLIQQFHHPGPDLIQQPHSPSPDGIRIIEPLTTPSEQVITCTRGEGGFTIIAVTNQRVLVAGENYEPHFNQQISNIRWVTRYDNALIIKANDNTQNRYEMETWEEAENLVYTINSQKQSAIIGDENPNPAARQAIEQLKDSSETIHVLSGLDSQEKVLAATNRRILVADGKSPPEFNQAYENIEAVTCKGETLNIRNLDKTENRYRVKRPRDAAELVRHINSHKQLALKPGQAEI